MASFEAVCSCRMPAVPERRVLRGCQRISHSSGCVKLREQPVLCNESPVVNAQLTSSDVCAKLEQEGASFNSLDPPLGL